MSAFIVSKAHIDAIVNVAIDGPKDSASRWDGINWSRNERHEMLPDVWSDVRWYSLATAGLRELVKNETEITADQFGQILYEANVDSVDCRYDETNERELYVYAKPHRRPTVVEAFKLLACFEYQACETADWEQSEAYRICQSLKEALPYCLHGYSAAPWEWSTEAVS